jgi:hypothetical protein
MVQTAPAPPVGMRPIRKGVAAKQVLMARMMSRPFPECPACGGSLQNSLDDPGWLKCFACSRTYETHTIVDASTIPASPPGAADKFRELLAEFKRNRGAGTKTPAAKDPTE